MSEFAGIRTREDACEKRYIGLHVIRVLLKGRAFPSDFWIDPVTNETVDAPLVLQRQEAHRLVHDAGEVMAKTSARIPKFKRDELEVRQSAYRFDGNGLVEGSGERLSVVACAPLLITPEFDGKATTRNRSLSSTLSSYFARSSWSVAIGL